VNEPIDLHAARVRLFAEGYRRGFVTLGEIDAAIPRETERPFERWLTLYSLQAIGIEIRGEAQVLAPGAAI
jgi:hypothetical protein